MCGMMGILGLTGVAGKRAATLGWSEPWRRNVGCVDCGGIALVFAPALLKMALCPRGWPYWSGGQLVTAVLAKCQPLVVESIADPLAASDVDSWWEIACCWLDVHQQLVSNHGSELDGDNM